MPAQPDAVAAAVTACDAADDKNATGLLILEVADVLGLVDVFVVASAASDRQLRAVVDEIDRRLGTDHDRRPLRREGTPESGWMLLDYGDVVCHVFDEERRDFFALERLWGDVPRRDPSTGGELPAVLAPGRA